MNVHEDEASPASEVETTPVVDQDSAAQAAGETTAAPPTAPDVKEPERTLLDVVKDAVQPEKAPADTSPQDPEKSEAQDPTAADPAEFTSEEIEKLPFGKHPRFKQLLAANKDLKGKLADFEAQVGEFKTGHEQYQIVDNFLRDNNIVPDEFVRLMKIGALVKNDPEEALKEVYQVAHELRTQLGDYLPPELQTQVEEGQITEEAARELSRTKAKAARLESQSAEDRAQRERETEADQSARHAEACVNAVAAWETQKASKDPDYSVKAEFVIERIQLLNATQGFPKSPEEAVKRAQDAYDDITARMRKVVPPKPEMRRGPTSGAASSNLAPNPKSLFEAIERAVG